ncbi:transposase, partial [Chloroflexota bacterium]
KLEALALLKNSGKSASQIERDLGITQGLLVKWRDRYQVKEANGEGVLAPSDLAAAEIEIRRLRRQLAIAEQERDILKKAVSIFSRIEG